MRNGDAPCSPICRPSPLCHPRRLSPPVILDISNRGSSVFVLRPTESAIGGIRSPASDAANPGKHAIPCTAVVPVDHPVCEFSSPVSRSGSTVGEELYLAVCELLPGPRLLPAEPPVAGTRVALLVPW